MEEPMIIIGETFGKEYDKVKILVYNIIGKI